MSFIDTAEAPIRQQKPSFERLKSIKDVRQAMTRQQSIVDHVLHTTLSKESVGQQGHGGDSLRQTVRNTMVFQLKKSLGSMRSIASTVSSAAKAIKKLSIDEEPTSAAAAVPKLLGHENHVEEIRQAVIRLVADGDVKTELAEGEHVSYDRQGDLKFYTDENLQMRLELRVHPLLCRLTRMFWLMVGPPAALSMEFDGYQGIMVRIHKVLIELFDVEESKVLIKEDWVRDTNATHQLTYELFHLSLFELIDIWCDSLQPDDYCNLMYLLMNGIAHMQSGTFRLRRLQDINYTDVVEELHLRPRTPAQIEIELDALEAEMAAKAAAEAAALAAAAAAKAAPPSDVPDNTAATPPPDTSDPKEDSRTSKHEEITLNIPSGMMSQLDQHDIRPTKLHKVKLATHATAATTFRPDAMPIRVVTEAPRNDVDLFGTVLQVPKPRNDLDATPSPDPSTTPSTPPASVVPESPPPDAPLTTHQSTSNSQIFPSTGRHMSQALHPTDMANVLANATSAFHTDLSKMDAPAPALRHTSLARPVNSKRSIAYNPNLKDPNSPRKKSYQKRLTEAPTASSGFFIKSISGLTPIPAAAPAIAPPVEQVDPTPPPQAQAPPPEADASNGNANSNRPPVFNLAGAKSPRGHPVWKPKRPGNNDRYGLGVEPPGFNDTNAAFAVKGLGGHAENAMFLGAGRPINYLASSGPTMNMGPLTGNGIGILGGKPTYKPPKDTSARPTGVVMAPKRDQGVLMTSSTKYDAPGLSAGAGKLDDLRSPTMQVANPTASSSQYDNRFGGPHKRGRQLAKQVGAVASEMVQDLATLSFGIARPATNSSQMTSGPPPLGPPLSPTTRDTDLRLGSPSAYSKLYRGGQRLISHLTSQTVERDEMFDGQLVARKLSSTPTPYPPQTKQSPRAAFVGSQPPQYDRNLANLQFNVQALNSPASSKSHAVASPQSPGKKTPLTAGGPTTDGKGLGLITTKAYATPR